MSTPQTVIEEALHTSSQAGIFDMTLQFALQTPPDLLLNYTRLGLHEEATHGQIFRIMIGKTAPAPIPAPPFRNC